MHNDHQYKNFYKMAMITALTALFVLLSLGLVVVVPVALATPGEWENSKIDFNLFFRAWVGFVLAIATVDGIATSLSR